MKGLARIAAMAVVLCMVVVGLGSGDRRGAPDPLETPVTPGELLITGPEGRPRGACPLKHTDVSAQVSGFIARVTVEQEFTNPTQDNIEAVYTFPLPEDSAVDRMEMTVGSRTISGEIHRREEASRIYLAAKEAGHVAALLDQERPNIFTQSVVNIMPGEVVKISISYTQMLKYEAGLYEFVFPMVVGPRYMPGDATGHSGTGAADDTNRVPDASRITPPITPEGTRAGHDISLRLEVAAGIPIQGVKCDSHEVDVAFPDQTTAVVELKNRQTIPNKDFVLRYEVAGEMVQSGLITTAPTGSGGYFALIMQPPKTARPRFVTPKEMMFIIDTSGSQMGEPMKKSKETMLHCIENVNPGDTFNMVQFAGGLKKLFDRSQPFNQNNKEAALKFLQECEAGGGTNMLPAIEAALAPPYDPNRLRVVVFFTDGYIGNDSDILNCVQNNLGSARVFSFGIGNSVNRFLIEKMAEIGRGASEVVLLGSDGQKVAEKFYGRIRNPILTDVTVDWGNLPVQVDEVYPKLTPDLFSSQPLVLKGRYTAPASGQIVVRAKVNGEPWERTLDVTLPRRQSDNDSLASIWARAKVDDLMSGDWAGVQRGSPDPAVKDAIVELALDHSLVTQYTSFVAVEKMVVTTGGAAKTIAVPVEMPEGVSYDGAMYGPAAGSYGSYASLGALNWHAYPASRSRQAGLLLEARTTLFADKLDIDEAEPPAPATEEERARLRLGKLLADLVEKYKTPEDSKKLSIPGKLVVEDGKVEVMLWLKAGSGDALAELEKLGLARHEWIQKGKILVGWLPVDKLLDAAKLESVVSIAPPAYAAKK